MRRLIVALGFVIGGCAALQRQDDLQNYEANCTDGAWTDPLCSEIGARQGYERKQAAPAGPSTGAAVSFTPAAVPELRPAKERSMTRPGRACCKTCRSSQPCGNSCISWSKTCRQPPGCAC